MTSSAMRGARRGFGLLAGGIIFMAGSARAQDVDADPPEAVRTLPPGAVAQSLDTGPGAELRRSLATLAENPRSLDALIGAGRAALGNGDGEAAQGFFSRAQEIAPADARVKAGLASAQVLAQRPETALVTFAEAVRLGASESEIAGDRGLAYDMVGDPRHAQQDYTLYLGRHPEDPETERRLALSLAISGQREAALRVIDGQLRRQDRSAWRTQAFVLALTGDASGAQATAARMMPGVNAEAMAPFLARLSALSPAQKAAAVHFGRFPTNGRAVQVASNVDTRPDPGAMALAGDDGSPLRLPSRWQTTSVGGPAAARPAPQAAAPDTYAAISTPVSSAARRRPGAEDRAVDAGRRLDDTHGTFSSRTRLAEAPQIRRFQPAPAPAPAEAQDDADKEDQAAEPYPEPQPSQQAQPVQNRYGGPAPREAPAFAPGATLTLDSSHEQTRPSPPPPTQPVYGGTNNSVRQFQSVTQPPVRQTYTLPPRQSAPTVRPGFSDIASSVRSLQPEVAAPSPTRQAESAADRASRDAAARAAEERYRGGGAPATSRNVHSQSAATTSARHWVQLATGTSNAGLVLTLSQMRQQAPALLSGRSAWRGEANNTHRLLVGPLDSESEARSLVTQLRSRRINAVSWTSDPGASIERLQAGDDSSSTHTSARTASSAGSSGTRTARGHDEERGASGRSAVHGRTGSARNDDDSDCTRSSHNSRSGSRHGRAGHDSCSSAGGSSRSGSNARTGRSGHDEDSDCTRGSRHGHASHDSCGSSNGRAGISGRNGRSGHAEDSNCTPSSRHGRTSHDTCGSSNSRSGHDDSDNSNRHGTSGRSGSHGGTSTRSGQNRSSDAHESRTSRGNAHPQPGTSSHGRRTHQ